VRAAGKRSHLAFFLSVLSCAALVALRCAGVTPALGSYDEIHLISEDRPPEEALSHLREALEVPIETVQKETLFHIFPVDAADLDPVRNRKNLLFLVDLSRREQITNLAREMLGAAKLNEVIRTGEPALYFLENVWARQQTHAYLVAPSAGFFPRAAEEMGTRIRNGFLQSNRKRILEFLLFRGEKATLAGQIYERFGWRLRMPAGFQVSLDHMEDGFFSMRMDRPGRMLFVRWQEGVKELPSPEEAIALRDSLGRVFYDEDYVERSRTKAFPGTFQERPSVRIQGLWQNEKYTIGGAFRSILFLVPDEERLFLIDYAVYAPSFPKKYYLWELEAVVETFTLDAPPEPEGFPS
jgi:hypothetical protein